MVLLRDYHGRSQYVFRRHDQRSLSPYKEFTPSDLCVIASAC